MRKMWTVGSVNGEKNGQAGKWTTLDQIQGEQTRLRYNVLGISFRIIPIGEGKYRISEVSVDESNPYYEIMEESGMDPEIFYETITRELENGEWTELNIKGLMDYGVVTGITTRLDVEDQKNGVPISQRRSDKLIKDNKDIYTMRTVEYAEMDLSKYGTDVEILEFLEVENLQETYPLVYQKYKKIEERSKKVKISGAEQILRYIKMKNLTIQDLSLALAMAQATKTGVKEAESHIVSERTSQESLDKNEPLK